MPCLEISMPAMNSDLKARLAERLTRAFSVATSHPVEILGIRFHEYSDGEAASGGVLCSGSEAKPYLHLLVYCPRLNLESKRVLVSRLTEEFCATLEKPDWKPVIHICEHPYENVGVEGELLSDTYPELAERPYYYELSRE